MEKQITVTVSPTADRKITEMVKKAANTVKTPLRMLRKYYSSVLGRNVSRAEARAITEAQIAFFITVMPADLPIIIRLAACAWLVAKVKRIKSYLS